MCGSVIKIRRNSTVARYSCPDFQVLNKSIARAEILTAALIGVVTVNDALIWINRYQIMEKILSDYRGICGQ
jgi:lambda repressor-like predicted transcriptional regulator